jgi:hypothetical protein
MPWKNLAYWLKGGIIGGMISLIFHAVVYLLYIGCVSASSGYSSHCTFGLLLILPTLMIFYSDLVTNESINLGSPAGLSSSELFIAAILLIVIGTILGLIIGAVIGLIIGKIKSKRKK